MLAVRSGLRLRALRNLSSRRGGCVRPALLASVRPAVAMKRQGCPARELSRISSPSK
jgi:hypothetical protein